MKSQKSTSQLEEAMVHNMILVLLSSNLPNLLDFSLRKKQIDKYITNKFLMQDNTLT